MNMTVLYEIASVGIAIFIVLFSSITFCYGINYLKITRLKKRFDWIIFLQIIIALAWIIIFGYIIKETIKVTSPIIIGSFGNLFIRPVILLSSVVASIWMYVRYQFEKSGRNELWNLQKN